jgi:hypothetical protein
MSKFIKNQDAAFLGRGRGLVFPALPPEENVLAGHRARAVGNVLLTVATLTQDGPKEASRELMSRTKIAHYVPVSEIPQANRTPRCLAPRQFRRESKTRGTSVLPFLETVKEANFPTLRCLISKRAVFKGKPRFPLL